jgi:hypothetical protein
LAERLVSAENVIVTPFTDSKAASTSGAGGFALTPRVPLDGATPNGLAVDGSEIIRQADGFRPEYLRELLCQSQPSLLRIQEALADVSVWLCSGFSCAGLRVDITSAHVAI